MQCSKDSESLVASIETFDQQYKKRGIQAQRKYPNEALIQFLARNFGMLNRSERNKIKVLEIGSGSGANLWMIAKEGYDAYGVDTSQNALEIAEEHLKEKWNVSAQLKLGSVTDLPFQNSFFDVVVDIVTLQHLSLSDSEIALNEVDRVLKTGGDFFSFRLSDHSCMFGSGKNIDYATIRNIENAELPLANNGPMTFWSPSLACHMYGKANLPICSIERHGRTYNDGSYVEYLSITAKK